MCGSLTKNQLKLKNQFPSYSSHISSASSYMWFVVIILDSGHIQYFHLCSTDKVRFERGHSHCSDRPDEKFRTKSAVLFIKNHRDFQGCLLDVSIN